MRCVQIVARVNTEHPFGVAAGGGRVFWSEWLSRGVYALDTHAHALAEPAGGARAQPVRLRSATHRPMALVAVTPDIPVSYGTVGFATRPRPRRL